jgi:hypothetical protein
VLFAERLQERLELIEELEIDYFDEAFVEELERKYHDSI